MTSAAGTLTADDVERLALACLGKNDSEPGSRIVVEGIVRNFDFSAERIAEHRSEIKALIRELPSEFMSDGGGGWSFLNLCNDRHGHLWTGLHAVMEALCCLAIGAGIGKWQLPREMWDVLPGGMPYVVFTPAESRS
jgi:hypothetical protein